MTNDELSFSLCQKSIRARVFHPYSNCQAELRKTCLLGFDERALEEWHKPGAKVRELQNKKLEEALKSPRIELTSYVGYLIATRQNPGPPVIDWYIRSSMKRLSYLSGLKRAIGCLSRSGQTDLVSFGRTFLSRS